MAKFNALSDEKMMEALYRRYRDAAEDRARPEFTMFEPHRAPGQDDD
jgi:hypothetical protein